MKKENDLQLELITSDKYKEWLVSLPDYISYEMQNSGFQLHHLVGKFYGFLDEDMTIPSLSMYVEAEVDQPNILDIYQSIINKL